MHIVTKPSEFLNVNEDFWISAKDNGMFHGDTVFGMSVVRYTENEGGLNIFIATTADCPAVMSIGSIEEGAAIIEHIRQLLSDLYQLKFIEIPTYLLDPGEAIPDLRIWTRISDCGMVSASVRQMWGGRTSVAVEIEGKSGGTVFLRRDAGETNALETVLELIEETLPGPIFRVPAFPPLQRLTTMCGVAEPEGQAFLIYDNFLGITIPSPTPPPLTAKVLAEAIRSGRGEIASTKKEETPIVRIRHTGGYIDKPFSSWTDAAAYVTDFIANIPQTVIENTFIVSTDQIPLLIRRSAVTGISAVSGLRISYIDGSDERLEMRGVAASEDILVSRNVAGDLMKQLLG